MTRTGFIVALLALGGCAVGASVSSIGNGAFMTSAHSNDVNARVEQESAQAMAQADAYCKAQGGTVDVIKIDAPSPTPGRPPAAEVDFRCK